MRRWLPYLFLAVLVLVVFLPAVRNGFVDFDDQLVITENPHVQVGLRTESITWAFTTGHFANWMPITWLTHLLDWELYGSNAGGHHLTSVLWHLVGVILLFDALRRMTGEPLLSFLVAAFYAVHPLHVESVVWIAERKGIVSSAFYMAALWAYSFYVREPNAGRMALVAVAMGLGLMAKQMVVSLPLVLLLLDYWPLTRRSRPNAPSTFELVFEKWPLFLLAVLFIPIAYLFQHWGEAVSTVEGLPIIHRVTNLDYSAVVYLRRLFWPSDLSVFYPHPKGTTPLPILIGSLVILLTLTVTAIIFRRRAPWVTFGWLWYLITLMPVSGLIPIGSHGMADRYSDIPLIGIYIALVGSALSLCRTWRIPTMAQVAVSAILLSVLAGLSLRQVTRWKDTDTLFTYVLTVDPDNIMALNELGSLAWVKGDTNTAEKHFLAALEADPAFTLARTNYAGLLAARGDLANATEHFREAAEWGDTESWFQAAKLLLQQGKVKDAIAECEHGFSQVPGGTHEWTLYGYLLMSDDRPADAEKSLLRALAFDPDNAEARRHLAVAYLKQGKIDGARTQFAWASSLNPKVVDDIEALVNASKEQDPILLDIFAACLSEVERFGLAAKKCEAALLLAARQGKTALIPGLQERLRVYLRTQKYLNYESTKLP